MTLNSQLPITLLAANCSFLTFNLFPHCAQVKLQTHLGKCRGDLSEIHMYFNAKKSTLNPFPDIGYTWEKLNHSFVFIRNRVQIKKLNLISWIERIKNIDRYSVNKIEVDILKYTTEITLFRFNGANIIAGMAGSSQFSIKLAIERRNRPDMGVKGVQPWRDFEINKVVKLKKFFPVVLLTGHENTHRQ